MESAGFTQLQHEWWHYDALPKQEVRQRFRIVE
jgi:D-alanyl-D-alanine dipeptidase